MFIQAMIWLCLLSPLASAIVARAGCRYANQVALLVVFSMLVSFWMSISLFYHIAFLPSPIHITQYTWAVIGPYHFEFGFWLDAVSCLMAVMISGISSLVCIYSLGYMHGEKNFGQFFSYIAFFSFAMLWLVFADNLLQLFFGWEGVGVASYILIGFWSEKEAAAFASTKAFIMNRVGDMGLLIAMALILQTFGSLHYDQILLNGDKLLVPLWGLTVLDWIGMGLLLAAMAKSAQMPLHLWLPDSMVGPTPISALIHAATMVTAGVFLISRFALWFSLSSWLQFLCVAIGLSTAILMGLMALTEYNLKRIIAYSTVSQLGNMVAVCGLSGYAFSLFHLVTHAVFKALLFLTAGAIILATDHQEDVRDMSGLKSNPVIHLSMILGLLSLCAIPPLGGFFSKDAILILAKESSLWVYVLLMIGGIITTLYSARVYYLLFIDSKVAVLKPISQYITTVLWVLMFLSVWSGSLLLPFIPILAKSFMVTDGMQYTVALLENPIYFIYHAMFGIELWISLLCIGSLSYWHRISVPEFRFIALGYGLEWVLNNIISVYTFISRFTADIVEYVIDYVCVMGGRFWAICLGKSAQALSTGKLYHYMWMIFIGMVAILMSVV